MKTPLPTPGKWLHERCGQKVYTESQLRAAMVAAYNEAIEDAVKVCQDLEDNSKYDRYAGECPELILKLRRN